MSDKEIDPYANYGLLDKLRDMHVGTLISNPIDAMQHVNAPEAFKNHLHRLMPDLPKRVDRNITDQMINFGGAYDWAIRDGIDMQTAIDQARAYQYGNYSDRPQDSVADYYENIAGIEQAIKDKESGIGRRDIKSLLDIALEYAKQRGER